MSMSLTLWIILFLVVDAVAVYLAIRHAVAKRGGSGFTFGGENLRKLTRFSKSTHEEIGRHLQAHYSGDPAQLPQALHGLLSVVRSRAEQEGLTLDDQILKKLIEISAYKHKIASPGEIRAALERAA